MNHEQAFQIRLALCRIDGHTREAERLSALIPPGGELHPETVARIRGELAQAHAELSALCEQLKHEPQEPQETLLTEDEITLLKNIEAGLVKWNNGTALLEVHKQVMDLCDRKFARVVVEWGYVRVEPTKAGRDALRKNGGAE